jgi:hypothetical protein
MKNNKVNEAGRYGSRNPDTMSPNDYDRFQQDQMDFQKRDFKRREMEHELGHEDDPNFERKLRQQQIDKDRGPWFLKVNGKVLKSQGQPKTFDWKKGANNYALAIIKNKPELQGKIFLTRRAQDDETVAEESGTLKVSKDDDNMTILQNPSTGVQTQIDKKNPNAPRISQDDTGKLKLQMPGQGGPGADTKPNLIGKDVEISTSPVEEVTLRIGASGNQAGDEVTDVNPRSAISGDEDHDEITKLLTHRLRKLAGL